MKVCILGDGLSGLSLAKALVNKGIYTDIFSGRIQNTKDKSRTIGISKSNVEFFNKNILNIEKLIWDIKKIEVFSSNLDNQKILSFDKDDQRLFSIVKNHDLISNLSIQLKKNKFFKLKKKINNYDLLNNYNLIFNCDSNNKLTKKFFYKKFKKNYNSYAYTSIIEHKKLSKNNTATQIFTKGGPIAFLPISESQTSIVYSLRGNKKSNVENLIRKFNTKYTIKKITNIKSFELKSIDLRLYYYKNILAFGDLLHKIHPLAGQGFNMTIRDIKSLLKIIDYKLDNGLDLDSSVCSEFMSQNKHKNYLFSQGIDFIYEFFNFENKINNNFLSKSLQFFGNNKISNKFLTKFADEGILI
jgi:2-octaprenyl-6-methoxyphenol hydroxylase